jgi:NADH-quinone oxidoreductase subunit H
MLSGTLNLSEIVNAQEKLWYVCLQPLAFVIFIITAIVELNRAPFDMSEAEQEIVAGYHTEYSGIRFAFFYLAEYANLFSLSALGAALFLGGWQGGFFPSWVWFVIKVYIMIFIFIWVRWSLPRLRLDQMMKFNWKVLIPLSLANILITGLGIKLYQHFFLIGGK